MFTLYTDHKCSKFTGLEKSCDMLVRQYVHQNPYEQIYAALILQHPNLTMWAQEHHSLQNNSLEIYG